MKHDKQVLIDLIVKLGEEPPVKSAPQPGFGVSGGGLFAV
jgi:hypothetical protein